MLAGPEGLVLAGAGVCWRVRDGGGAGCSQDMTACSSAGSGSRGNARVIDSGSQPATGLTRVGQGTDVGGRRPLARVFGQAALDQRPDLRRNPVQVRRAVDHAVNQCVGRPAAERPLALGGEDEDRAQAEHVARRPDITAFGLLGGHDPGEPGSAADLIPKSTTRGPSSASSTFEGFRSRCTTPAA